MNQVELLEEYLKTTDRNVYTNKKVFEKLPAELQLSVFERMKAGEIKFELDEFDSSYAQIVILSKDESLRVKAIATLIEEIKTSAKNTSKSSKIWEWIKYLQIFEIWESMIETMEIDVVWKIETAIRDKKFYEKYSPEQKEAVADYFLNYAHKKSFADWVNIASWAVKHVLLSDERILNFLQEIFEQKDSDLDNERIIYLLTCASGLTQHKKFILAYACVDYGLQIPESKQNTYVLTEFLPSASTEQQRAIVDLLCKLKLSNDDWQKISNNTSVPEIKDQARQFLKEKRGGKVVAEELLKVLA